ncbi:hypothetical protein [Helicobacter canadensis]|uniref:hypothetical protein n=1 Tax=Helicobacter canadensis TaxID=123841 RepID=UPI00031E0BAF|nr:hypothetical protein [Helicobacter canadensis]
MEVVIPKIRNELSNGEAKILLSSQKYMHQCLQKLQEKGIQVAYNGIKYLGERLNLMLKEKYKGQKICGIFCDTGGNPLHKYLGNIREILNNNGIKLIYFLYYESEYYKEFLEYHTKNNDEIVMANYEFLSQFDFVPFVITHYNVLHFHPNVVTLRIHSSFDEVSNYVWLVDLYQDRGIERADTIANYLSTYLNIHSQTHYRYFEKNQQIGGVDPNPIPRFLKGGYPSIDRETKESQGIDFSMKRDTVIFISALINFYYEDYYSDILEVVLKEGYRVVFKSNPSHISFKEREDSFALKFKHYSNFIYQCNDEPQLSLENKNRSITIVGACSSLMYSYPALTKRPAILLYPEKNTIPKDLLDEDCFYNPKLHIRLFKEEAKEGIIKYLKKLSKDLEYQKQWQKQIEDYCKNDLYNFGDASRYIANFILEWYQARSILKE